MVLNNVDRVAEQESTQDTVRSYQLLFAKYIYEAGTEGYLQQPFRQDHQTILGDQEIERAELPVIESFEADCQQYQVVYRSDLYSTGRVNKIRLIEEQQKLSLGDTVAKQLGKVVRQEFYHACDVYRELYAADVRDDGQLNNEMLQQEQTRWGLSASIVQAIASTEQSTFTTDKLEYRRVAAQAIHQTGRLDAEELRTLQLQFSFGHQLLEQLHYEVEAEFQNHVDTYHQQFLDMLRHNGSIGQAEQARLHDLRQVLGNIHPNLMAEFEATAIATHEQNVVSYAEEARQVIQQFTDGNVNEPTPEEQESLLALSHWYDLSPAIAAQVERVVRAEILEQQTAQLDPTVQEPAPESLVEASVLEDPSLMDEEDPVAAVSPIDAGDAAEVNTNEDVTQAEDTQPVDDVQADPMPEVVNTTVAPQEPDSTETIEMEAPTPEVAATAPTHDHTEATLDEEPVSQEMSTQQADMSDTPSDNPVDDGAVPSSVAAAVAVASSIPSRLLDPQADNETEDLAIVSGVMAEVEASEIADAGISEMAEADAPEMAEADAPEMAEAEAPEIADAGISEMAEADAPEIAEADAFEMADARISEIPDSEASGITEVDVPEMADATPEITDAPQEVADSDVGETDELPHEMPDLTHKAEISDVSDVAAQAQQFTDQNKAVLNFGTPKTTAPKSGRSKVLAVGASIVAGVVLIGGAITMLRGSGRDTPIPAVDLQSNTVEIAQSGTNTVVAPPDGASESKVAEGTTPESSTTDTMETLTEVQQLIQDRQVVSGLKLLASVPSTENTAFEVDGILRQVFQQAEAYYQEGLYTEATTVVNTMTQLFPKQDISEEAAIASKEWQNRWHANLATLKVAEDALEKQEYDSAIAEAQKVSHPGLQIEVATIIDKAIQAKQEQAALAEQARQNRVPPQSGSPAPRATVAPRRSAPAPAPRPTPRATPQPAPKPAAAPSQSPGYYSPDPL